MRLVSFLGTTDYAPLTYTLPENGETHRSRYVQEALVAHYDIAEVVVLVTAEARAKHADALRDVLQPCGVPLDFEPIANPVDEAGQWKLFEVLAATVKDARRAILDVTHSFRSAPLIGVAAALYLEKLHDLQVEHIVYGQTDMATGTGTVVELSSFLSLIKLTNGADIFKRTGDARPLQRHLARRTDTHTSPVLLHNLGHMGDALHLLRGPELARAAEHLHLSLDGYLPPTPQAAAEHAVIRHVDEAFAPFRHTDAPLRVQLEQVSYYTKRRSWSAALVAVVELIITTVCKSRNLPADRRGSRKEAQQLLNDTHGAPAGRPIGKALQNHYSKLKDYRNQVSHNAQGIHVDGNVQALSRQIEQALRDFLDDAPSLLEEHL